MDTIGDDGVVLEEVIRADRMAGVDLSAPQVQAALDALGRDITAEVQQRGVVVALRRRKRRKTATIGLITAALLAAGTPAAAQWVSLHTGLFGSGTEMAEHSELLDTGSPELAAYMDKLARDYRLPPGGNFDQTKRNAARQRTLIQREGLEGRIAAEAICQWEQWWLDGDKAGDRSKVTEATTVLQDVPTWRILHENDGGGVVDLASQVAAAAAAGNRAPIHQDWVANCTDANERANAKHVGADGIRTDAGDGK